MVTLLVNVMIKKKCFKDKTWRSWSPADDRWWTHSTTHWQSRSSHSGKYQSSPSALCGSCKKNKAATARPDTATNFGAQLCGIQDNKCVRVVCMEALWMPSHPPKMATAEVVQPQVQELIQLLERWVTHQPPTHQKCMPAPAAATEPDPQRVITSRWSSRVTTASLPAPLTFFLPLSS